MASYESSSTESLILEVQKYPQLYDTSLESYKDAVKKQDIWESVGARVDMPGNKKIRHFKKCFRGTCDFFFIAAGSLHSRQDQK